MVGAVSIAHLINLLSHCLSSSLVNGSHDYLLVLVFVVSYFVYLELVQSAFGFFP